MLMKIRSYVLPAAILLGLLLHKLWATIAFLAPYFIFVILLLNFVAVDLRKLHFSRLQWWILAFQVVVSIGTYYLVTFLTHNALLAQGLLIGVLCPVASSVVVIACLLGADRQTVTAYTVIGNLAVAIAAPLYFSFIGVHQDMGIWASFWLILKRVGPTIGLPFFVALLLQLCWPRANDALARLKDYTFYIWAFLLTLTLGQTIDFIFLHGKGNELNILWLGIASVTTCAIQFGVGKWVGQRYGDSIAGAQMLGQKNTAMGIWMANTYLIPLASVFLAFYSIWQNIFNSWRIWRHDHQTPTSAPSSATQSSPPGR
ncbi:MAG: transporter [Bacteroidales bacterium]|nr:transporter [Bacteroidales bacterium]